MPSAAMLITLVAQAVSEYQVKVADPQDGAPQVQEPQARVSAMPVPAACGLGNAAGQETLPGVARQTAYAPPAEGAQTWPAEHPPPTAAAEHALPAGAGGVVDVTMGVHPFAPEGGRGATSW